MSRSFWKIQHTSGCWLETLKTPAPALLCVTCLTCLIPPEPLEWEPCLMAPLLLFHSAFTHPSLPYPFVCSQLHAVLGLIFV